MIGLALAGQCWRSVLSIARSASLALMLCAPTLLGQRQARDTTDSERFVWLVDDYPLLRARLSELQGKGPAFPMLRSTSSLLWEQWKSGNGVALLTPQVQLVTNSAIPFSRNSGALWAGKGSNTRVVGGVAARLGRLTAVIAPEFVHSQNRAFPARVTDIIPSPPIPPGRSPFSFPWYANGPYSLDMPMRFGNQPSHVLRAGQTSVLADLGALAFGFSTENEWWGPGVDNALILSTNAPGFPHLTLRTIEPLPTRLGAFEFHWLVGGLTQSAYFDTSTSVTPRSISAAAVAFRPRALQNLSFGLARAVIGTSSGWGPIPFRWFDVLRSTGHPNSGAPYDSTLNPGGRDQIVSAFARWVLPASGAELYGEWGRLDLPVNLRDLLVQPNRGLAYTFGLQWSRQAFRQDGLLHLRLENTSLEQSLALRNRFAGVWYTSRRVLQGFTNEGQVLGAALGPGSSGQTAEVNYLLPGGYLGFEVGRSRYNEDVHEASPMLDYLRWCSHDVNLGWGVHGAVRSRFGTLTIRSLYQDRLNAWFQGGHGCPRSDGMVDIRNRNLTITISPLQRW